MSERVVLVTMPNATLARRGAKPGPLSGGGRKWNMEVRGVPADVAPADVLERLAGVTVSDRVEWVTYKALKPGADISRPESPADLRGLVRFEMARAA